MYFTLDTNTKKRPSFYYNFSVKADNPWKAIPTDVAPPSLSPLVGSGGVLEQVGEPTDLLRFAVETGIWISAENIRLIFTERGWEYPRKPGSGKGSYKSRKKSDFVDRMISKLFPDASDEEKQRMRGHLLGKTRAGDADGEDDCEESLLKVISGLDPENAIEAKGLRKQCFDKLSKKLASGSGDKVHASGWTKKHFTPVEFRELLPPAKETVWIKRLPGQSSYVGFYDRTWFDI